MHAELKPIGRKYIHSPPKTELKQINNSIYVSVSVTLETEVDTMKLGMNYGRTCVKNSHGDAIRYNSTGSDRSLRKMKVTNLNV